LCWEGASERWDTRPGMLTKIRHAIGERIGRPRRWRLLEQMPKGAVCAEIGVFKGDYTRRILQITKPQELHLIDPWWKAGETYEHVWFETQGENSTRGAYEKVKALAAPRPECKIHVGRSQDVLPKFPDGHFDWVYLDSSHEYRDTVEELELLRLKVKPGGVIAGDDWFPDPDVEWHGIYRAVTEFCERYGWEVVLTDIWDQWAIRERAT
jgi:SAM-dependent methyltransferase